MAFVTTPPYEGVERQWAYTIKFCRTGQAQVSFGEFFEVVYSPGMNGWTEAGMLESVSNFLTLIDNNPDYELIYAARTASDFFEGVWQSA